MKLGRKHRIYPDEFCREQIARQEGCNRLVWNKTLEHMLQIGYWFSYYEMAEFLVTKLRPMFPYLNQASAQSMQQCLMDLHRAIRDHVKNPKMFNQPRFKKKKWRIACRFPQFVRVDKERKLLYLSKMKDHPIRIILERDLPEYTMCTVVKEGDGRYYVSFNIELEIVPHEKYNDVKHLGLDMGVHNFIVTSNGETIPAPKLFRKSERNIVNKSRALSAKTKNSRQWIKCRKRLSRAQSKIRRQRADWIHKLSYEIASDKTVDAVGVESLNIRNLLKNKKISKSILDAGWSLFITYLEYKLEMRGKTLTRCSSKFPSTQLCSTCNNQTGPKSINTLKIKNWVCSSCGTAHDRDVNAARNIAKCANVIYGSAAV